METHHGWEVSPRNSFDPCAAQAGRRKRGEFLWVDLSGNPASTPDIRPPTPEDVLAGNCSPNFDLLRFRDPGKFVAGSLHDHPEVWENVLQECSEQGQLVGQWLRQGLDLYDFFQPFQGSF